MIVLCTLCNRDIAPLSDSCFGSYQSQYALAMNYKNVNLLYFVIYSIQNDNILACTVKYVNSFHTSHHIFKYMSMLACSMREGGTDKSHIMSFLPICGGGDYGYLPSKAALRHTPSASNRIGPKAPEHTPQHHLWTEDFMTTLGN